LGPTSFRPDCHDGRLKPWTLFTGPLNQKLGTTLAEIQITFSLLLVLQTFFSRFQAYLFDRLPYE
jgi:hypothetical protein